MSMPLTLVRTTRAEPPETIAAPSWDDVERVLRSLDGDFHCDMFLGDPRTQSGLIVGGGPSRYFSWIQWMEDPSDSFDNAVDPQAPAGSVRFTLDNGQVDEWPLSQTIDLTTALRIARTFFERQDLDPDVTWDHNGP